MKAQLCAALAALVLVGGAANHAEAGCVLKIKVQNERGKMIYVRELEFKTDKGSWSSWSGMSAEKPKFIKSGKTKTWSSIWLPYPKLYSDSKVKVRAIWSVADGKHQARSNTFWSTSADFETCAQGGRDDGDKAHIITVDKKKAYRK